MVGERVLGGGRCLISSCGDWVPWESRDRLTDFSKSAPDEAWVLKFCYFFRFLCSTGSFCRSSICVL